MKTSEPIVAKNIVTGTISAGIENNVCEINEGVRLAKISTKHLVTILSLIFLDIL